MHSFYLLRHIRASSWIEHSNFCRFKWRWKCFSCDTVSRLALIMLFDRRTYKVFGLSGRHGRWSRKPPTWAQNSGNVFITQQSVTHPKKHLFYTSVPLPPFSSLSHNFHSLHTVITCIFLLFYIIADVCFIFLLAFFFLVHFGFLGVLFPCIIRGFVAVYQLFLFSPDSY